MPFNYTYNVTHTNVASGTPIRWALSGSDLTDFVATSGEETADGTGSTEITLQVNESSGSDPDRPFVLNVSFDATPLIFPDATLNITLTDGASTIGATFDDGASITINETDAARNCNFTTTGSSSGTLYWNITTDVGGTSQASTSDWVAVNSGGSGVSYTSSSGTISIDAVSDLSSGEGAETFYLQLRSGSDTGTILDTLTVNVTDDSLISYSLSGSTSISEPQAPINYYSVSAQNLLGTPAGTPPVKATLTQNVTSLDVMHAKIGAETIAVNINGTKSNGTYQGTYSNTNVTATANSDYLTEPSNWGNLTYNSSDFTVTDAWSINQAGLSRPAVGPNVGGSTYGTSNFTDPEFYLTFKTSAAGTYNQYISGLATGTDNLGDGDVAKFTGTVTIAGENTYTVTTAGVSNGTNLYWECESVSGFGSNNFVAGYTDNGIATSDVAGKLRGRVTISSNSGTFNVRLDHDATSTSSPTFNIKLYSNSGYTTLVDTLGPVTINNSTKYISAAFDVGSINEDATATATYTLTTSGVTNGTTVGYNIRSQEGNISLSDILVSTDNVNFSTPTQFFGTLTINSNTANLYFRAAADSETEASTQKIIIDIDETDSTGTNTYAYERLNGSTETRYGAGNNTSAAVTINDTSQGAPITATPTRTSFTNNGSSAGTVGISFAVNSSGTFAASSFGTAAGSADFTNGTFGNWLLSGSSSDYEVQMTFSGDTGIVITNPTSGGYVSLSSGQTWVFEETYPSGNYTVTGTLTIRDIATSGATEQESDTISFTINAV